MKYLIEILNKYNIPIIHTILVTIISYTSLEIKKITKNLIEHKIKKEVITMVYHAIKEFYPNSTKEEQLNLIINNSKQILKEKNIKMTSLELKIFILSTIHTMKGGEKI